MSKHPPKFHHCACSDAIRSKFALQTNTFFFKQLHCGLFFLFLAKIQWFECLKVGVSNTQPYFPSFNLTLVLCLKPCSNMTSLLKLLLRVSLLYIINKYWIQSFCLLVFFFNYSTSFAFLFGSDGS